MEHIPMAAALEAGPRRPSPSTAGVADPALGPPRARAPLLRDRGRRAVPHHRPERRPDLARAGGLLGRRDLAVGRPAPRLARRPTASRRSG